MFDFQTMYFMSRARGQRRNPESECELSVNQNLHRSNTHTRPRMEESVPLAGSPQ